MYIRHKIQGFDPFQYSDVHNTGDLRILIRVDQKANDTQTFCLC